MPSPVGEGGSQRLTDEAFFPRSRFCCKVTHYSSSTAKRSPFSSRRRQRVRRRKVGAREGVRVVGGADPYRAKSESRYEDERSVGKKAHSSSTALRSPFSDRRRQGRAEVGMLTGNGVKAKKTAQKTQKTKKRRKKHKKRKSGAKTQKTENGRKKGLSTDSPFLRIVVGIKRVPRNT